MHTIETDAYGRARSVWSIAGLRTSLTPRGRDKLVWSLFVLPPVEFDSAGIGRALTEAGRGPWLIRQTAAGDREIRALDGRSWVTGNYAA
jgi:hypothetical protein